ncbi:ATP-dependent Clp protease adapter ClpS [Desulfonema ishimotonii]|uniref:ATP-dependent Clp protease adapter protein ClpS n=1 Tax=Desulfonema ishimotonii TaxID=45657 RepID=A0A401FXI3_9BACT|nr:ATP-dependent Clp protease adapter ClpS [Desulfonema ishimotonii]GBC61671.1 ATP-dependent Clp protease adapter ClpS [Desulfonema ishimotonii]
MSEYDPDTQEEVVSEIQEDIREPSMYRVLLHNDDYTTMEFVVEVLMFVFNKSAEEATQIMLNVHHKGVGVCGVYTCEIAETKVDTVEKLARENEFPLKCTMEEE